MSRYYDQDDDEKFECDAKCKIATSKALLVAMEDGSERWVPKSVVHDDSEVYDSDENNSGKLVLKGWWAEQEGLA